MTDAELIAVLIVVVLHQHYMKVKLVKLIYQRGED